MLSVMGVGGLLIWDGAIVEKPRKVTVCLM